MAVQRWLSCAPKAIEVRLREGGTAMYSRQRVPELGDARGVPDAPGLRESQPLTHVEALELGTLPEHLIVLGGGNVGPELAQPMRRSAAV